MMYNFTQHKLKGYNMINDNRAFSIDDFNDLVIDGKDEIVTDIPKYIGIYIKEFDIARVGVSIVRVNAMRDMSPPSDMGTMYNLYMLFKLFKLNMSK